MDWRLMISGPPPGQQFNKPLGETMKKFSLLLVCSAIVLPLAFADDDGGKKLQADPFVFIGKAGDCGTGMPAGSRIVTSAWLTGMGLPDDGTSANAAAASRNDPHSGLLLSKNGPTANCSAAGATIKGAEGMTLTATSELGFDYRNGGHCGAGAPRFNLVTSDNMFHFIGGCANGTNTAAPQDPAEWTRSRFTLTNPAQAFPPITPGTKIKSLSIIFDEGTDSTSAEDPRGVGLAVIDNIDVNGNIITRGDGKGDDKGDDKDNH
jgi:hypothetical protein